MNLDISVWLIVQNICTYILTNINTSYGIGEIFKKLTFIAISIDNTYAILKTDFL